MEKLKSLEKFRHFKHLVAITLLRKEGTPSIKFQNPGQEIRNKTMYKIAVSLLKRYGNEEIAHQRYDEASSRCNPPLEDDELKTIFNSALKNYNKVILPSKDYIKQVYIILLLLLLGMN